MSDRPSGLTALVVFNALFGFVGLLQGFFAAEVLRGQVERDVRILYTVLTLASHAALLLSALGLLLQRRWLGRGLATLYAVLDLTVAGVIFRGFPPALGGELSLTVIRALFYPLFVLYLVHGVFRRDLVR